MININRNDLFLDLLHFAKERSGLVVGNPGVGKSFMLKKLKTHFLDNNIVCFLIPIDHLNDASDEAIQNELGLQGPWIETFKNITITNSGKALLIFDAFDAARNEDFRKGILSQIRKAKLELADKWNILVSARTYDAEKSQQLIQLFPLAEGFTDFVNCRKLPIHPLRDEEVQESISDDPMFKEFYSYANNSLKEILRIPFFLHLADIVLHDAETSGLEEIKQYRSETQLLKRYWNIKVKGINDTMLAEQLLIKLTTLLVEKKTLSIAKKAFPVMDSEGASLFNVLRSNNIIDETSVNGGRIAFGHNILFDYAVSSLYLTTETDELISFIQEDSSRPFFLRPSFIYFFTQCWYEERTTFWILFTTLSAQTDRVFQLFVRLALTGVIASEFASLEDLQLILKQANTSEKDKIRNLLQSLRFLRKNTKVQDVQLLDYLSATLDTKYLWDFSYLLDRAIKDEKIQSVAWPSCGNAARNFLNYILQLPLSNTKSATDRLGAIQGVELVCKTYETNPAASRALLESLFRLLNQPDFEIYYFTNLAQNVKYVLPHDPDFVAITYRHLFEHEETSNAETTMGNSVIMSFKSNRRQDFEMSYYHLVELFPTFIDAFPDVALPVGLKVINGMITKDRSRFGVDTTPELFHLKAIECKYLHDHASMWADSRTNSEPSRLMSVIIGHLRNLLQAGDTATLQQRIDLYIANAIVGYTWKRIIEFGVSALPKMSDYFFDFCTESTFYLNSDTSYEIRELIEKGSAHFSPGQIRQIEEKTFQMAEQNEEAAALKFAQRYLSRIPPDKLQLEKSKQILDQTGTIENERPITFTSYSGVYTNEEWLRDSGVDTSDPLVTELLIAQEKLSFFTNRYMNDEPSREEYVSFLKMAFQLFERVKTVAPSVDNKVVSGTLHEIAQTVTYSARNIETFTDDEFELSKEIVEYCFQYISEADLSHDEKASTSSGWSPTPRITISEALMPIAERDKGEKWQQLLATAVRDRNAVVRLNACRNLSKLKELNEDLYWTLVQERLQSEDDAMVAANVFGNSWIEHTTEERIVELLNIAYRNEHLFKWQNSFIEQFILKLVRLWLHKGIARADEILCKAWERGEFQQDVIFETFKEMRLLSLRDDQEFMSKYMQNVVRWTTIYLNKAAEKLKVIPPSEFTNQNPEVKAALKLIDLVIQRCYFVLEAGGRQSRHFFAIPDENRAALYGYLKPIYEKVLLISSEIVEGGLIAGHTAHYFIQTLNACIEFDTEAILDMVTSITKLSLATGYTFDSMAVREVVSLTEKLLADHRDLLADPNSKSFDNLIFLLDTYMQSGWVDALELLWKLDEVFK